MREENVMVALGTGKKLGQNTRDRERGVGRAACTEAAEGREREGVGCGMWDG